MEKINSSLDKSQWANIDEKIKRYFDEHIGAERLEANKIVAKRDRKYLIWWGVNICMILSSIWLWSLDWNEQFDGWAFCITCTIMAAIILTLLLIVASSTSDNDQYSDSSISQMMFARAYMHYFDKMKVVYKEAKATALEAKFGKLTKELKLKPPVSNYSSFKDRYMKSTSPAVTDVQFEAELNNLFIAAILVYESSKTIIIQDVIYNFKDIVSCTYSDDYTIKKGKIEYESKTTTDTGSMVGRAVVGGALLGGAGAVIGGGSASKTTQTIAKQDDDTIIHNYTVIITMNSLENSTIRINTKSDEKLANEIISIINIIVKGNTPISETKEPTMAQPTSSTADEIMKLVKLKEIGAITEAEFEQQKKVLLS